MKDVNEITRDRAVEMSCPEGVLYLGVDVRTVSSEDMFADGVGR